MPTRIQIAKPDIFELFESSKQKIYQRKELQHILAENRNFWRLAQSTTVHSFIEFLTKKGKLRRWSLPFPHRKETRFAWGEVPLSAVLMSLKPDCHFSHYTAISFHGLTEQDPKSIYVNFEQRFGRTGSGLDQDRIHNAFKRSPRITNNFIDIRNYRVYLINGRQTGYLGVESHETVENDVTYPLRVTDLERTLIDAAVRPFYCGGVVEVLKAYQLASTRISTNRMAALLKKIDYVYPYHQVIGFYMEKAGGYSEKAIELFRSKFSFDFDFYLTYQMHEVEYNHRWKLFYPRGM